MKNTLKKSTALFMALAIFAMIISGCKKSDSNNGGVTPTPPTPGSYGTFTVGDKSYDINYGAYTIENDTVGIVLANGTDDINNLYGIALPNFNAIPEGTFDYMNQLTPQGDCIGLITSDSVAYYCSAGSVTITKSASNYKIVSTGKVSPLYGFSTPNSEKNFTVNFEGPLVNETETK